MDAYVVNVIFKMFLILAGIFCIYLGYRLFVKGVVPPAGEVDVKVKSYSLIIRKAAPGTFLFILGAAIIIVGITRVFQVRQVDPPKNDSRSYNESEHKSNRDNPEPVERKIHERGEPDRTQPDPQESHQDPEPEGGMLIISDTAPI